MSISKKYRKQLEKRIELEFQRERALYVALLEKFAWDRAKAAKQMKMSRASFYRRLAELGLTKLSIKDWRKL